VPAAIWGTGAITSKSGRDKNWGTADLNVQASLGGTSGPTT
jgi:hypothetical protein